MRTGRLRSTSHHCFAPDTKHIFEPPHGHPVLAVHDVTRGQIVGETFVLHIQVRMMAIPLQPCRPTVLPQQRRPLTASCRLNRLQNHRQQHEQHIQQCSTTTSFTVLERRQRTLRHVSSHAHPIASAAAAAWSNEGLLVMSTLYCVPLCLLVSSCRQLG